MAFTVTFHPARNGGVMTRVDGRVAFPSRGDHRAAEPAPGETWEVEVEGLNPRGTVVFLRLLRSPAEIKQRKNRERAARDRLIRIARERKAEESRDYFESRREELEEIARTRPAYSAGIRDLLARPPVGKSRELTARVVEGRILEVKKMIRAARDWAQRVPAPDPGPRPASPPDEPSGKTIPSLSVWVKWTESWEGDGLRMGKSNVRTYQGMEERRVIDPSAPWERPVRDYLRDITEQAGISQDVSITADIEKLRRRMKKKATIEALLAARDKEHAVHISESPPQLRNIANLPIAREAKKIIHARIEKWAHARRMFLLSNLEKDGGVVRLANGGVPYAPVIDGEEPCQRIVTRQENGEFDIFWTEITEWEVVESWMNVVE
ncbi:MAG: hypothetical protein DRG82_15890 [Deltaproteobacteria bacterium]|nr:MAG: hypothetical protein DRG82_15890 [Deltaproteobacteria bacterium]